MNKLTTLCYIEKDNKYLMLHRIKKENDINHDKWIGVGGKFELGESPEECLLREVKEETGYTLTAWKYQRNYNICLWVKISWNTCLFLPQMNLREHRSTVTKVCWNG